MKVHEMWHVAAQKTVYLQIYKTVAYFYVPGICFKHLPHALNAVCVHNSNDY